MSLRTIFFLIRHGPSVISSTNLSRWEPMGGPQRPRSRRSSYSMEAHSSVTYLRAFCCLWGTEGWVRCERWVTLKCCYKSYTLSQLLHQPVNMYLCFFFLFFIYSLLYCSNIPTALLDNCLLFCPAARFWVCCLYIISNKLARILATTVFVMMVPLDILCTAWPPGLEQQRYVWTSTGKSPVDQK